MTKKKFNSPIYTKGKFGKRWRETLDTGNEYLYSHGKYPTKIRKEDLPEDYVEIHSRVIWYMFGYLKTSGVVDVRYKATKINHLFKDDYLHISYNEPLKTETDQWGFSDYVNDDICLCGNSIIPVVLSIEKYSPDVDTSQVREAIKEKFLWYKEHYPNDYFRQFGNEDIDLFEYYKEA